MITKSRIFSPGPKVLRQRAVKEDDCLAARRKSDGQSRRNHRRRKNPALGKVPGFLAERVIRAETGNFSKIFSSVPKGFSLRAVE